MIDPAKVSLGSVSMPVGVGPPSRKASNSRVSGSTSTRADNRVAIARCASAGSERSASSNSGKRNNCQCVALFRGERLTVRLVASAESARESFSCVNVASASWGDLRFVGDAGGRLHARFFEGGPPRGRVDELARKKALRMVPYGLYLLGCRRAVVKDASDLHAYVVSWVTQTSFKPPMIVVGVGRSSLAHQLISESRVFSLNFLGADQKDLAKRFFKEIERTDGHLSGAPFASGPQSGCPLFLELPASIECEVVHMYDGENDHSVVVAKVVGAEVRHDAKPLTTMDTGWSYAG